MQMLQYIYSVLSRGKLSKMYNIYYIHYTRICKFIIVFINRNNNNNGNNNVAAALNNHIHNIYGVYIKVSRKITF